MLYEYVLTIPANTAEAAPVTLDAPLAPGVVARVDVQFPRGCVGLVHVQIWRSEHQVWPGNLDGDIAAEGLVVSWPESYDLDDEPFGVVLRGWSDDDSFSHAVTFRFSVLPFGKTEGGGAPAGLLRRIAAAMGLGA